MIHPVRGLVMIMLGLSLLLSGCNLSTSPTATEAIAEGPFVFLLAPVNKLYEPELPVYASGSVIILYAIAQDPGAGVARLDFSIDGAPLQQVNAAQPQPVFSAQVTWTAGAPKKYLITVEGFRADGSSLGRDDRPIQVVASPVRRLPASTPAAPATPTDTPATSRQDSALSPASTPGPNSTPALAAGRPLARVNANPNLNVRQGPGTQYVSVGVLNYGDQVEIIGRSSDGSWWAIPYRGGTGWIFAPLTQTEGDTSQVPLVAAP